MKMNTDGSVEGSPEEIREFWRRMSEKKADDTVNRLIANRALEIAKPEEKISYIVNKEGPLLLHTAGKMTRCKPNNDTIKLLRKRGHEIIDIRGEGKRIHHAVLPIGHKFREQINISEEDRDSSSMNKNKRQLNGYTLFIKESLKGFDGSIESTREKMSLLAKTWREKTSIEKRLFNDRAMAICEQRS